MAETSPRLWWGSDLLSDVGRFHGLGEIVIVSFGNVLQHSPVGCGTLGKKTTLRLVAWFCFGGRSGGRFCCWWWWWWFVLVVVVVGGGGGGGGGLCLLLVVVVVVVCACC